MSDSDFDNIIKLARMSRGSGKPGADDKRQRNEAPPEIGFGDELDMEEFPPLEWIVKDLIPTGLGVLAGKSKIGKSWLAYDLALACSRGTLALKKVTTMRCETLYLTLEDTKRRIQFRMRKLLAGEVAPHAFVYARTWPSGMSCLQWLDDHLERNPACRLVIIDPFAKVRGGSPDQKKNAYAQDYEDMTGFHELANRRNVAILLIFHTRKQDASDVMDLISGTTAIQGASDYMMVLTRKRGQSQATFAITGRDIENDSEFAASFDKQSGKWELLGEAQEVERESAQDKVFQYLRNLRNQKGGVRLSQITAEIGINRETVRKTLYRLAGKGIVEHVGRDAWKVRNAD